MADINNCCFVNRQCAADQEWVDGYWAYQRNECPIAAPINGQTSTQPVNSTPANVDNCCFLGRHCTTDAEWVSGYWAYQNGQCGAPSQTQSGVGNCCDSGWDCNRDFDFIYGNWAAQHNRCFSPTPDSLPLESFPANVHHSRVRIGELTSGFTTMVNAGFELLRVHTPQWYAYVTNAINEVNECHNCTSGVFGASGITSYHHAPHSVRPYIRQDDYTMAEFLVHEACHVYQDREGRAVGGDLSWTNEYECELYTRDAAYGMGGVSQNIGPR